MVNVLFLPASFYVWVEALLFPSICKVLDGIIGNIFRVFKCVSLYSNIVLNYRSCFFKIISEPPCCTGVVFLFLAQYHVSK